MTSVGTRQRDDAEERPVAPARAAPGGWQRLTLPVVVVVAILWLELVLRVRSDAPLVNSGLVYTALFAGATGLLVSLVASLLDGILRILWTGLCLTGLTALFLSQLLYHDIFTTYYTVFSAAHGGQAAEFADVVLARARANATSLLLTVLPLLLFLAAARRACACGHRYSWRDRGLIAGLACALTAAALLGIGLGDRERGGPYDLYYRTSEPVASVNQLGLVTSMRLDLQRTLLGVEPEHEPPPPVLPPDTESSSVETNTMDIDFEELMAEAGDEGLENMHLYFSTLEATNKNDHTGMFEGYNVVFITAEAFSHYAVDEEITPTLHRMSEEGLHFTDVYNPFWDVSTSDGEYVATTSLLPKRAVWSLYQSGTNAMPFALGNQLGELGYTTKAYHNHTYDYYRRDMSHPNLGYDYQGIGNGLEMTKTWPRSDLEMIDVTTPEYVQDEEPFHAYYMTISGHMRYDVAENFIAEKNQDLVADLPYTDAGKAYLATQIELDRALELLLERLEEAGVAENTLIVLGADHYPYGLEKEELDDLAGHEVEEHFELYRSSLIMYAVGMEPEVIEEPVSNLDILPTVSNLLGLEFDSRLLMGRDVFSQADPLVIFNDRSFITDLGRYNSVTREFLPTEGAEVPEGYQELISDEIDRKFYYSARVLDRDYYSIVVDR